MKANCIYHREQPITNFCQDKHCLMPLCPECISQHTQYHEDERTRPQYLTIQEIMSQVHMQIANCIELLTCDQARNGNLMVNIRTVPDKIRQKISQAKELVYRTIEQSFILLEKDINKQLQKYHQDKSIYSLSKSQKQDQIIIQHLDQLQIMKNTLKSERGLSNLIYFLREKYSQVNKFHTDFSVYLHTNQNYSPRLEINNESLYSLDAQISRIVKIGPLLSVKGRRGQKQLINRENQRPKQNGHNTSTSPIKIAIPQTFPTTTQKLKQRHNIPIIESQVKNYSPHLSRIRANNGTDRVSKEKRISNLGNMDNNPMKVDLEYEQLSRKVALMRQENNRLSRIIGRTDR